MDEANTKDTIQRHAEAVERGDFDTVIGDMTVELQAQAAQIAQSLPQPVTSANVLSVELRRRRDGRSDPLRRGHQRGHDPVALARRRRSSRRSSTPAPVA